MASLGLGQNYTVVVTPRDGFGNIGFLEPSSIKWSRKLNDSSAAQITVDLAGGSAECCALAGGLRTWGHQIRISRDGTLVWEGPIVHLEYGGNQLVIDARDVAVWLSRRVVKSILDFRGGADLSLIAEALIEHGLERDDPNVLPYLQITESHISGVRYYDTKEPKYILDELNELGRTGVDYTVIGRRIAVFPELSNESLITLRQDDFMDELKVTEDGLAAATYAQVRGSGVTGEYGGLNEFYGLLERTAQEDNILDVPTANLRAQAIVQAGSPVPLYITTGGQSRLACTAPVDINELVPGIRVPITLAVGEVCRAVSTTMRLVGIDVSVSNNEEAVSVNLALPGVENE